MKTIHNILRRAILVAGCAACLTSLTAGAQHLQSGYFDSNFMYRYRMNPAYGNDGKFFIAMPALGNLNATTQGNVGLDAFIYNVNGKTTTFLNPEVSASEFMSSIKDKNRVGANIDATILAGGFKAFGGYNTVTLSARADVGVYIPKALLSLAKEGISNGAYNITNTGARAQAWAELAFGHSRNINKQWRVGGTLKFLLGGANMEAKFHSANIVLGQDNWVGEVNADLYSSVKGLTYKHDYNDRTQRHYVSGIDVDNTGLNGFGMGLDLGAVFTLNKDWEFSASLLDLGFIRWSNNMLATTHGPQTVVTDKYTFGIGKNKNDDWDRFRDDLSMLYELDDAGDQGGRTTGVGVTMNLAAQYTFPLYRDLTFGLLNTSRFQGEYTWTDFRLSANVQPLKWLSGGINLGVGTFGASFGWLINFKTRGFNFFLASDRTPGKLAKQGVPLNSNINVSTGLNFTF
ncbi:MAG: DUF5723 family protein [Muribaculaceae bacterium]